jgi:hypothetical protein
MEPDEDSAGDGFQGRAENDITVRLDRDLYRYIRFLEATKIIGRKEDALLAALRIFKRLNMHDWLPSIYRMGDERVLMISQGMLHDIFTSISESKLYDIARMTALKRKVIKPYDPELDLNEPDNWGVILNGLENMGWGKFTQEGEEIMAEYLVVPIAFLKGYLETLFQAEFSVHQTREGDIYVLSRERSKAEVWR